VKSYRAISRPCETTSRPGCGPSAPGAKVTGEFDISLNAVSLSLGGELWRRSPPRQWCSAPNTRASTTRRSMIPTWESSTPSRLGRPCRLGNGGSRVKVAIIDTGIEFSHPCFNDAGYAPQNQLGDRRFTNNKVDRGQVFQQQDSFARLHRGSDPGARHARRRNRRLQLRDAGYRERRHHSLQDVRGRPPGAARQLQRLSGCGGQRRSEDI